MPLAYCNQQTIHPYFILFDSQFIILQFTFLVFIFHCSWIYPTDYIVFYKVALASLHSIYVAKATSNPNLYQSAKADCNGVIILLRNLVGLQTCQVFKTWQVFFNLLPTHLYRAKQEKDYAAQSGTKKR